MSNIVIENAETHCDCGKKFIIYKRDAETKILSSLGYIPVVRDYQFCRFCHQGYGAIDKNVYIYGEHRCKQTQIHIISEEVGRRVFQKYLAEANSAYEKPEEAASQELPMYRKEGRLCVLVDGSQVNTRIKDSNDSSWKEMKLGLIFSDKDMIKTESGNSIITKKEYIPYFGSVGEFKK